MTTPQLLVSVRDAAEAEAALAGGADLIDVKEPSRGALGRADAATIAAVVEAVGCRVPVSAALGELRDYPVGVRACRLPPGVDYVKWGMAGMLGERWLLNVFWAALDCEAGKAVLAAYADWHRTDAPRVTNVVDLSAGALLSGTVLIDTFVKDGSTLLDHLSVEEIADLVQTCHEGRLKVALAGSLGPAEIARLRGTRPDWFAVRGAACAGGREGRIEAGRVRGLKKVVSGE